MKTIDSKKLVEMFRGGAFLLEINKSLIDSLNVFPVPDGDTGTNMSMTMASAIRELMSVETEDTDDLAKAFALGALKGARGNSGVILSQIIKGLSKAFQDAGEIDTKVFAKGLAVATEIAYSAVTKPKEGTILTVVRVISESAGKYANRHTDFKPFMEALLKKGNEILSQTPEMLPVLKKAGVVDAGGKGLITIFDGFYRVLADISFPEENSNEYENDFIGDMHSAPPPPPPLFLDEIHDYENIKYAYCTEYFIVNTKNAVTEEDIKKLKDRLMSIGDSVIVIGDLDLLKVHVHTNQPNRALAYALQLGELDKLKIENMLQQNRELIREREANKKDKAIISVCAGDGITKIMRELLVDTVIEGGQTMNPSVEDILSAITHVNSDNIIILPNNKNIILACEQAKELSKKNVVVLPTCSIPAGIAALIAFDAETNFSKNVEKMKEAYERVKYGQVTYAVRTAKMDGFSVKEGDIIGLDSKKIIARNHSVEEVTKRVIEKLATDESSIITLYYGDKVTDDDAKILAEKLGEIYDEMDIVTYYGGQPHYYYLISIE